MKNILSLIFIFTLLLGVSLGCNLYDTAKQTIGGGNTNANDNRTVSEKAIDATIGGEKIGIPECDELFDAIAKSQAESADDSFVTKAAKEVVLNKIRESIKADLEQYKDQPNRKDEMAKSCREAKAQFDNYNSSGNSNTSN